LIDTSNSLMGEVPEQGAEVLQWLAFAAHQILPTHATLFYPLIGYNTATDEVREGSLTSLRSALETLDRHLLTRTFLVGESITLADINVTLALYPLFRQCVDAAFRADFINVNRYYTTIANQPKFLDILGPVVLCDKIKVPTGKAGKGKEQPKVGKAEPKVVEKVEKQPEAVHKPNDDEEEEESYEDEKPKTKNPLDLLPPSTFVLDTWKRFYSNNSEEDSIKYFWTNFDKEGFSVWRASYKFVEEELKGKQVFMTCNLLGGLFNRCEEARKYAFGAFLVFGTDGDTEIHGLWVFRGADIPAEIRECGDFESYSFVKLDPTDEEHKQEINGFLAWKEISGVAKITISTKPVNQGKTFK